MRFLSVLFFIFAMLFASNTSAIAATGDALWGSTIVSASNDTRVIKMSKDGSGNVYVIGRLTGNGSVDFGNGVSVTGAHTSNNFYVAKYNSSGVVQWAKTAVTAPANSGAEAIYTDSDGNSYVSIYISGTSQFNFGDGVTATGVRASANYALIKYSSTGTALWAKTLTTAPGYIETFGIDGDSSGNIYVVGSINGTSQYNFGNGVLLTPGRSSDNILIVKYDTSGIAQWARSTSTAMSSSYSTGVALDSSGNIYISGVINGSGSLDLGNSVTVNGNNGSQNGFVAKYSSSGVAQWAKSNTAATTTSYFDHIDLDSDSNIYLGGYLYSTGTVTLGPSISATGSYTDTNMLFAKYDSSGTPQWIKTTTSSAAAATVRGIVIDGNNQLFAVVGIGSTNQYVIDSVAFASPTAYSLSIVLKLNQSGVAQNAYVATSAPNNSSDFDSIVIDQNNNFLAAGYVNGGGTWDFGNGVEVSAVTGNGNLLIVKYQGDSVATVSNNQETVSNQSVSTNQTAYAPTCGTEQSPFTPDLFQIDVEGTSAKLYFSPSPDSGDYYISYSTKPNAEEHGVALSLGRAGVQDFTINHLLPNTKYYFKVRNQKDCMPGMWGNILSGTSSNSKSKLVKKFFRY